MPGVPRPPGVRIARTRVSLTVPTCAVATARPGQPSRRARPRPKQSETSKLWGCHTVTLLRYWSPVHEVESQNRYGHVHGEVQKTCSAPSIQSLQVKAPFLCKGQRPVTSSLFWRSPLCIREDAEIGDDSDSNLSSPKGHKQDSEGTASQTGTLWRCL